MGVQVKLLTPVHMAHMYRPCWSLMLSQVSLQRKNSKYDVKNTPNTQLTIQNGFECQLLHSFSLTDFCSHYTAGSRGTDYLHTVLSA